MAIRLLQAKVHRQILKIARKSSVIRRLIRPLKKAETHRDGSLPFFVHYIYAWFKLLLCAFWYFSQNKKIIR